MEFQPVALGIGDPGEAAEDSIVAARGRSWPSGWISQGNRLSVLSLMATEGKKIEIY
jgi:hypothetical protein